MKCPEHTLITCKRTFEDTRAALEEATPSINYAYRAHLESDNYEAALEALDAFPCLNNFTEEPRDFGRLLKFAGEHGRQALQYQIGNQLTATTMAKYRVEASLYLPVTVLLRMDDDSVVEFEYDRPRGMMRQFGTRP
ncbi:hypothetical protein DL768_007558 [Monosporascus sp. mg162]|nr:hypothetical protein DL768_007558 [Monosporascus sp. mg162]